MDIRAGASRLFDLLEGAWSSDRTRRLLSQALLVVFVAGLLAVELKRQALWPPTLPPISSNHLIAVEWVVDLLLLFELVDLIFGLAASVSGSLAKQLEVFALVLLRKSFGELRNFSEPIDLSYLPSPLTFSPEVLPLWNMAADAGGALALFGTIVVYRRLQLHQAITQSEEERDRFISSKKMVALVLLAVVLVQAALAALAAARGDSYGEFFASVFTAFIFFDIAIVLVSLRYSDEFRVVFRNFGFTVVTVFIRLAITANPIERAIIGVIVGLYAVGVAYLYNQSHPLHRRKSASSSSSDLPDGEAGSAPQCVRSDDGPVAIPTGRSKREKTRGARTASDRFNR